MSFHICLCVYDSNKCNWRFLVNYGFTIDNNDDNEVIPAPFPLPLHPRPLLDYINVTSSNSCQLLYDMMMAIGSVSIRIAS
jgi:hypothetical protein